MATSRDELRERLVAALEASSELDRDHRQYLADVFLSKLDEDFQLVPRSNMRGQGTSAAFSRGRGRGDEFLARAAGAWRFLILLPILLLVLTLAWAPHRPSFLLIALAFFVFWRFFWAGPRHYRGWHGRRW
jgi:hypothetical protein